MIWDLVGGADADVNDANAVQEENSNPRTTKVSMVILLLTVLIFSSTADLCYQ